MRARPILIILIIVVIIVLACLMGPKLLTTQFQKQDSHLEFTSNTTMYKGDNITVRLSDVNGTGIPNAKINISVINEEGADKYSVVTDSNGVGHLKIDRINGKYTINCTFEGDWTYKPSHTIQRVETTTEGVKPVYQVLNQSFNSSLNSTVYYDGNLNVYYGNNSIGSEVSNSSNGYIAV
jgi:hypothetical protein